MPPILKTQRLTLTPASMDDEAAIQQHINDYDIIKFLGAEVPWPYPPDGAKPYLRDVIKQMAEQDVFVWTIRLNSGPDNAIGLIEYFYTNNRDYNRGFWLGRAYQGQGIMSEALAATQDYILMTLGKKEIVDTNAPSNTASRKLKEHFGSIKIGTRDADYITGETSQEVWEVTQERWMALRGTLPYKRPEIIEK